MTVQAAHVLKVAWRSLSRNRRRTVITVSSIGFGLAISIFFTSMSTGVHRKAVEDGVRTLAGHLMLEHPNFTDAPTPENAIDQISSLRRLASGLPGVARTTAVVSAQGLAATGSGASGVMFVGVEPDAEATHSLLAEKLEQGHYLAGQDERGALVGTTLAKRLKLSLGKKLVLSSANAKGELTSELLRVRGIFRTGAHGADGALVQIHIDAARRLLGLGPEQASQVGVVLASAGDQPKLIAALEQALQGRPASVHPWQEQLPELSGWMELDRRFSRVMLFIILFLVGFTILNTLLMSVVERSREFAVLLALGTPPRTLRAQVLAEAALLALLGCGLGLLLGCGVSGAVEAHGMDLTAFIGDAGQVGTIVLDRRVHNDVRLAHVLALGGSVFLCTLLLGLYPMLKSTRVQVATLLRTR